MSAIEISNKVMELRELMRMRDELVAEIEAAQDALKAHMTASGTDTINGADFKVSWKEVTSSCFDSTAFKKAEPTLAAQYTKTTTCKRFTVQ